MPGDRLPEIVVSAPDPRADATFAVEVHEEDGRHHYVVTVPLELPARLGLPSVDPATLVRESFLFLLEREPATSILSHFDLAVIPRYFPEYEAVMPQRLSGTGR